MKGSVNPIKNRRKRGGLSVISTVHLNSDNIERTWCGKKTANVLSVDHYNIITCELCKKNYTIFIQKSFNDIYENNT